MAKATLLISALLPCLLSMSILGTAQALQGASSSPTELLLPKEASPEWDSRNQRMLWYRTSSKAPFPSLYVVDSRGVEMLSIDILKGFPGANYAAVASVAGGPNGSIVASCKLSYGEYPPKVRHTKEFILTYDHSGILRNVIDIAPYESSLIAVDEQGNIYSFASRTDLDPDDHHSVYPTIVKYSPGGQVLNTMLPSSIFGVGDDYPDDYSDRFGSPLLRVIPSGIAVFSASFSSLVLLSENGEIIAKNRMADLNQKIADRYNFKRWFVRDSFLDINGGLILRLGLDDGPNVPPPPPGPQVPLVRINPISLALTEIKSDTRADEDRLIGLDVDGALVFERTEADGSRAILIVHK